ncbi:ABC transporter permease subunit [[Mycoplasma] mobile]|uniref:ABC transporter permease subunit n=1 Tax=[Mycoplasma] mobile TaxID=2118 RepID=UPI0038CC0D60
MTVILIQIWLGHSYIFLLISGVKKSISNDFYEAASIDGASKWKQFVKITAPIILVQILPLLIGQIVFNFNNFGVIFLFNGGGPAVGQSLAGSPGATDIIISLIFKLTTTAPNRIALASAFTLLVSVFIVVISSIVFIRSKSFKEKGA